MPGGYDGDIKLKVDLTPGDVKKTSVVLGQELRKIFDSSAGKKTSAQFKTLQAEASKALYELERLYDKMVELEGTTVPTNEFQKLTDTIKQAQKEYKELTKDMSEAEKEGSPSALRRATEQRKLQIQQALELREYIKQMQQKGQDMLSKGTAFQPAELSDEYRDLASQANDLNNKLTINKQKLLESGQACGTLKTAVKGVVVRLGILAKRLASVVGNKVVNGFKRLGSHLLKIGQRARHSGIGLKQLFLAGLGINSLTALFNKLKSAIQEGLGNLEQYSPGFKATMNSFRDSLTTLKNAFATSFAPIAEVVLPLLTRLINTITTAVTAVGKLIAALTGKKTFTAASKSFSSIGDSANNANQQAQELQKTIAGFDDVEILGSNNPASSGSGSGGDGGVSGMFEEVPIENEFGKLAEMIKDAWKKADFTDIGRMIGEKLRDALNSIPWDLVKEKMRQVAKSIATLLNGFLETPGLFDAIGSTLAEALNSGLEFLNTFAKEFHWDSLGRAISDGINGFFRTADFKLGAETFSNWAKGLLETIYTTLENIDWRQIGAKIKEFITNIDWTGIVEGIARTIGAAIGGAAALIVELFGDIPGKIKEYFSKKIEEKKAEFGDNGKAIFLGILQGILDAVKGIGKWIKEHVLDPFITGFKNAFGIHSPADKTTFIGEEILNGILEGMLNIIKNIKKWVSEHVLEPIKGAFKGFKATIEVGLEKAKDWASDVWEGIKAGNEKITKTIKNKMDNISGWKDEIFKFFTNGVPSITKTIKHAMSDGKDWKTVIFDFFTNKKDTISKTLELSATAKDSATKKIFEAVGITAANTIKTTMEMEVEAAITKMKDQRSDTSLNTTAKYNSVDKTALTGTNKPWLYTDAHYNNAVNKLGSKPWFYADSYYNTAKNNLSGKPWYYADSYYNTANNNLGYKPWYYADSYFNTANNTLGYKPWYYADSYFNTANNSLRYKPWFYTDAYMNNAYDYIPSWQKVINVAANVVGAVSGLAYGLRWATGGIYTPQSGWSEIPQYAGGTTNVHGSMFIAGESGPEVVGHINGRTEVLNKSQIASAIYSAVKTAMSVGMNQLRSMIPIPMPINLDIEALGIPDIVKGYIIPYEVRLTAMEDMIANQNPDPVTGEELRGLMSDVIAAVNKVQFYIGDEQIARHVNSGNQKLDRRYNPVAQGG